MARGNMSREPTSNQTAPGLRFGGFTNQPSMYQNKPVYQKSILEPKLHRTQVHHWAQLRKYLNRAIAMYGKVFDNDLWYLSQAIEEVLREARHHGNQCAKDATIHATQFSEDRSAYNMSARVAVELQLQLNGTPVIRFYIYP